MLFPGSVVPLAIFILILILRFLPAILAKVVHVALGGGVSLGEQQNLCGDYIFSGHTMILAVSYLTVRDCQFTS